MTTPMLVSVEVVARHLRLDTDDGDADLELKIRAASAAILAYVGDHPNIFTDSAGDAYEDSNGMAIGVPEDVQMACMFLVGYLDRNRDSDDAKAFGDFGTLPPPIRALLTQYHQPAIS